MYVSLAEFTKLPWLLLAAARKRLKNEALAYLNFTTYTDNCTAAKSEQIVNSSVVTWLWKALSPTAHDHSTIYSVRLTSSKSATQKQAQAEISLGLRRELAGCLVGRRIISYVRLTVGD